MKKTIVKVLKKNMCGGAGFIEEWEYSQGYFTYSVTDKPERGIKMTKEDMGFLDTRKISYEVYDVEYEVKIDLKKLKII